MKRIYAQSRSRCKSLIIAFVGVMFASGALAQLATYPLKTGSGNPPAGTATPTAPATSPNVVPGTVTNGANMALTVNGTGYRVKTDGSNYPAGPTNGYSFDVPFKPAAGYDMNINGIKLDVTYADFDITGSTMTIVPYFQVNGTGPWLPIGTLQKSGTTGSTGTLNFGPVNETFYDGRNYVIRFYTWSSDGSKDGHNDELRIANLVFSGTTYQPPAQPITVTTTSITSTGRSTANIIGKFSYDGTDPNKYYLVKASGIIWSTDSAALVTMDTTAKTKTTDGSAGVINSTATGLIAGTKYYAKVYAATQFGLQYGSILSVTADPPVLPTPGILVTKVFSNKIAVTGTIIDDGGRDVTDKYFVWGANPNPKITGAGKLYAGAGKTPSSDYIKGLSPNTNYHVRFYAKNAVGENYSIDTVIKTGPPEAVLSALPGTIDFGENFYGNTALILGYTLRGSYLNGSPITITAPPGFLISKTTGNWSNTITLTTANTPTYVGATLSPTQIYVTMPTTAYADLYKPLINAGGGATPDNADTVYLKGSVIQSPIDVSNSGSDFYLGFGYEEKMDRAPGNADECRMSLYVTTGAQAATVHVVLNSGGYTQTQLIPANSFYTFTGFPTGAGGDARLYSTGISDKSIHVYTDNNVPVSVFYHSYTHGNSAAGAMIFPTNTWNSAYTVQAFGGISNNNNPNSFFFVIANEDNTEVTFTPTQPVLDATAASLFNENPTTPANTQYAANGTYKVTLNKGQVFNAMGGFGNSANGLDLSGSKVSTTCDKKITVFGGNGRCIVPGLSCSSTSGSDHLIQQMFPSVAWGTKYLTAPTMNTSPNYFRIYFQDSSTVVKVNGTTLNPATIKNNIYYEYQSATPASITSDKPINVTQFMLTPGCTTSAIDAGPEMIILSPIEQAISGVTFYSPTSGKNLIDGSGAYTSFMNVIIPTSKASTFKLDGVTPAANSFKVHPQDAGYSYASLPVSSKALHTLKADTGFVAIAYGYGDGESYGYNAGTAIKNLSSVQFADNPLGRDSSGIAVRACVDNPVTLKIALPFLPSTVDSLVWSTQGDNTITPANGLISQKGAITAGKAKYDSMMVVNGRTFYIYSAPTKYTFGQFKTYRFPVVAYGTFSSDCPGQEIETMLVLVGKDQANMGFEAKCGDSVVKFSADTIPMAGTKITKWIWDFGDGNKSINGAVDTSHTYSANKIYTAKFTSYNTVGCITTDSVEVGFGGDLQVAYDVTPLTVCAGGSITFNDKSVTTGGIPNFWAWDFGDGNVDSTTGATVTHQYNSAGKFPIKLFVRTSAGCSNPSTSKDTVYIQPTPVAAFTAAKACFGNATIFTNQSSVPNNLGAIDSVFWDFGDTKKLDSLNTATYSHQYALAGSYPVTLRVKSDGGCVSTTTAPVQAVVDSLPQASFIKDVNCVTNIVTYTNTSNAHGGTIAEWNWDFGDGKTLKTTQDSVIHHYYANGNGQNFNAILTIKTQTGCTDDTTQSFGIGAAPSAVFSIAPGTYCLPNANVTFVNSSSISDGTTNNMSYIWNFGDVASPGGDSVVAQGPPAASTQHIYGATGPYTVTLTAISNKGCTNSTTQLLNTIHPQPVVSHTNLSPLCLPDSLTLTANTNGINQWNWDMGDGTNLSGQSVKYAWKTPGRYGITVVFTSTFGCQSDAITDSITINDLPVASFTPQTTNLCPKTAISFTDASTPPAGSTITQWTWNFGDGSGPQTVSSLNNGVITHTYANAGTYPVSLSVKNSNGCFSKIAYQTTVTIDPFAYPRFDVTPICVPGADAQFTANSTLASGSVTTWDWNFGDQSAPGSGASVTHPYPIGGTYPVKLTATTDKGCVHDTTINVTAYDTPTALDSILRKDMLCSSAPVILINQSFVAGPNGDVSKIELFWDADNNSTIPDETINTPVVNGQYTHDYGSSAVDRNYTVMLKAYSGNGCPTTPYSQSITVLASPDARFDALAPVCQETTPFALSGGSDANNLGGTGSYEGLGVSQTDSVTYTFDPQTAGPGVDSPLVFTANYKGCTDTAQQTILVYPTPVIDYGGVQSILENDSATLQPVHVEGIALSYSWSPSLYLSNDTLPMPLCKPFDDISYTITVSSPPGCHGSDTLLVQVLRDFKPANTFTPNGDGINDTWVIQQLPKYPIHRIQIFNRYGQILFETHGYSKPWDGTNNGSELPAGTYYYIIELNGMRAPKTGYVTILR